MAGAFGITGKNAQLWLHLWVLGAESKGLLIAQPLPSQGRASSKPLVASFAAPLACDPVLLQNLDTALCSCLILP